MNPRTPGHERPECVACLRPFGRTRAVAHQLLGNTPVCDHCWHLAGGAQAILDRAHLFAEGTDTLILAFDERADAMIAAANPVDLLHPADRVVVDNGVRWSVLRTIIPRDRLRLTSWIADRTASVPTGTTRPDGPEAWLVLVTLAIAADTEEFKQPRGTKRRRWWRIARVFALCADRDGRPLTWAAHDVVAEAVGCSTKTVQRCLRWLESAGLLHEVVPGCVLRRCQVPEGETAQQRNARQEREALAEAAAVIDAEARRVRTEAELTAVRAGHGGLAALAAADDLLADQPGLPGNLLDDDGQDHRPLDRQVPLWDKNPEEWVRITPVYELRRPLTPLEREEADRIAATVITPPTPGQVLAEQHRDAWVHPANAHVHSDLVLITHDGTTVRLDNSDMEAWLTAVDAVTCGNAAKLVRTTSFVHPPKVTSLREIKSLTQNGLWISGRASRDASKKSPISVQDHEVISVNTEVIGGIAKQLAKPAPEARQVARWLLESSLDPILCDGVTEDYLTALIAGSGLLRHEWTWDDIRDEIHGLPEHPHLPRHIRTPRAFITDRLRSAADYPHLPPSIRRQILEIERGSRWFAENATNTRDAAREAERAARRKEIDNCPLCDQSGWLDLPSHVPTARCTHDPDTQGW